MATYAFDLLNGAIIKLAYKPAAIITATVAGTTNSKILDFGQANNHGFHTLIVSPGTITDGTFTFTINESDDSAMSGATQITTGGAQGVTPTVVLTSADSLGVGGVAGAVGIAQFHRNKRYLQVINTVTGSPSTGGYMSAVVVAPATRQGGNSAVP